MMDYKPLIDGDSSPYFGNFESQKYGNWDSESCWDYSAIEIFETRLEMLWKLNLLSQADKDWLGTNGYVDEDGDIYLSRRWIATISGVKQNGNYTINFWNLAKGIGLIPNKILPFTTTDDFFNPACLTNEMYALAEQFTKRFTIEAQEVTGGFVKDIAQDLSKYLKEGSVQLSIPMPYNAFDWNNVLINYPVGNTQTQHAVECYKFDPTSQYPVFIYDTYNPHLKQLSADYLIPRYNRVHIFPVNPPRPPVVPVETPKPVQPTIPSIPVQQPVKPIITAPTIPVVKDNKSWLSTVIAWILSLIGV